jgi:hypothetical protein
MIKNSLSDCGCSQLDLFKYIYECCDVTAGKPEGKRALRRPRRRWRDNIKMDLLEIGLGVVDWIVLAQDRYR